MNSLKIVSLVLLMLAAPFVLVACGGGASSNAPSGNVSDTPVGDISEPVSFTAMTNDLFVVASDSEPMDISKMDINSDADDETADTSDRDVTTTFSSMMTENIK